MKRIAQCTYFDRMTLFICFDSLQLSNLHLWIRYIEFGGIDLVVFIHKTRMLFANLSCVLTFIDTSLFQLNDFSLYDLCGQCYTLSQKKRANKFLINPYKLILRTINGTSIKTMLIKIKGNVFSETNAIYAKVTFHASHADRIHSIQ